MPKLALAQRGRGRPCLTSVVGADNHQVVGLAQHVQRFAGNERSGMNKGEIFAMRPCSAMIVRREDLAAIQQTVPFHPRQLCRARTTEVQRGHQPAAGQSLQPRRVAVNVGRVGRLVHDHELVGQGSHRPLRPHVTDRPACSRSPHRHARQRDQFNALSSRHMMYNLLLGFFDLRKRVSLLVVPFWLRVKELRRQGGHRRLLDTVCQSLPIFSNRAACKASVPQRRGNGRMRAVGSVCTG